MDVWQTQIAMLPVRRPDPDAKRKNRGQAARAEGCRLGGLQKRAQTESKIRGYVRKTPGILASEVAALLGFSRNYTYKVVRDMIEDGTLRCQPAPKGARPLYLEQKDTSCCLQ